MDPRSFELGIEYSFFKDVLHEIHIFNLLRSPVVSDFGNILSRLRVPTSEPSIFMLASVKFLVGGVSPYVFQDLGALQGASLAPLPTPLEYFCLVPDGKARQMGISMIF